MKIDELKQAYAAGELPKPFFLGALFSATRPLFEVRDALAGTQIREFIVTAEQVRVRTVVNDLELVFDQDEVSSLVSGLLAFGDTERTEREVLLAAAAGARCILDIGANVGWYSLHFSRVAPDAEIYAFEPVPQIHQRLLEHLEMNGVTGVKPEKLALQDREEEGFLYFHKAETGATSARNNRGFAGATREAVRSTTLDRYCADNGISPELIKCDVEGSEWAVIKGGVDTIERHRPAIFLELLRKWSANFGYHPNDVIAWLAARGYQAWAIEQDARLTRCVEVTDDTVATNFLFVDEGRHADLLARLGRQLKLG